jgi:hypothetical protein
MHGIRGALTYEERRSWLSCQVREGWHLLLSVLFENATVMKCHHEG